jgi:PIN domain nuclease of toxin-antitoxin system
VKLLLDTHIWIWGVQRPEKLSRAVRRRIEDPANEIYLSPISIWEAKHLARANRLRLKSSFAEWLRTMLAATPLREAPFDFAAAREAAVLDLLHPDPGDLILAATAVAYDLTLVTSDRQLIDCRWLKTLPNE